MDIEEFWRELEDDVLNEAKHPSDGSDGGSGEDFKENAFTRIVIGDMSDAGALESPTECHYAGKFKGHEFKVNAYDIPVDDSRLDLVVTDYRHHTGDEPGKLNADDIDRDFKLAERFLAYLLGKGDAGPDVSQKSHAMIYDISSRKANFKKVQISLITNCVIAVKREGQRPRQMPGYAISHDAWDLERLRRLRAGGSSHEPIEVDLSGYPGGGLQCLSNADPLVGYSTSIAVVPGSVLADWYEEYGARLLELNVRSYLQAKGKINKGILETLVKEPNRFLAYNNGITIVAEEIVFTPDQNRIQAIRGLQIVNGGQTTASIHRAKRHHHADLSHVYVQAKITKVPADQFEEIVPEISRLSNTQNKVSEVDLRAHHRFHVGLERVAKRKWVPGEQSKWFYERTRGSYQTERARIGRTKAQRDKYDKEFPADQRLTKEDVARYVNVYDGFPHIVSMGGQKNFKHFMDSIPSVDKEWEPSEDEYRELVGKAILYRRTQIIAKEVGVAAFRINIVNYTVALIADKTEQCIDFQKVWNHQDLSVSLKSQIREWLPKVAEVLMRHAVGRNPTEWFKLEQCWLKLKEAAEPWRIADELMAERRATSGFRVANGARNDISACKKLGAKEWFHIYQWGEQTEKLSRLQLDIARRMSELAFGSWRRDPTSRQAAEAINIISIFEQRT
jgi:hypothetical protein